MISRDDLIEMIRVTYDEDIQFPGIIAGDLFNQIDAFIEKGKLVIDDVPVDVPVFLKDQASLGEREEGTI